jgi:hypothetical protein
VRFAAGVATMDAEHDSIEAALLIVFALLIVLAILLTTGFLSW